MGGVPRQQRKGVDVGEQVPSWGVGPRETGGHRAVQFVIPALPKALATPLSSCPRPGFHPPHNMATAAQDVAQLIHDQLGCVADVAGAATDVVLCEACLAPEVQRF